jgi:hypothetical protein
MRRLPISRARARLLALLLCAAAPVLVSAVGLVGDWHPLGDSAAVALRSEDVLTRHNPLIGMPTTLSASAGKPAFHPGPAPFQVVALHRLLPIGRSDGVLVAVALCNVLAAVAVVLCARELGRRWGALLATVGLLVLLRPFRGELLVEPWPPFLAFLPFVASIAAAGALAAGRRWALPLFAVTAGIAAQAHLGYVAPVAGAALFVLAVRVRHARRRRAERTPFDRRTWLAIASTSVVLAVMWLPVLWQQLTGSPGNLSVLAGAGGGDVEPLGTRRVLDLVVNSLSLPPEWALRFPTVARAYASPSPAATVAAVALLVLAVVAAVRLRHRHPGMSLVTGIALSSLLAGIVVTARSPLTSGVELHNVIWIRPLGAALQLVALAGVATWLAPLVPQRARRLTLTAGTALAVIGALVVAATPSSLPLGGGRLSPPIEALARQVGAGRYELVSEPSLDSLGIATGLLFADRSARLLAAPDQASAVGRHRIAPPGTRRLVVQVSRRRPSLDPGGTVLAAYDPPAAARRRARAVQAAFRRYLRGRGPIVLVDGTRLDRAEVDDAIRSGRFAALLQFDAVRSPAIGDRWFRALLALEAEPLDYVRLVEAPAGG